MFSARQAEARLPLSLEHIRVNPYGVCVFCLPADAEPSRHPPGPQCHLQHVPHHGRQASMNVPGEGGGQDPGGGSFGYSVGIGEVRVFLLLWGAVLYDRPSPVSTSPIRMFTCSV